jgi:hypothetical protein
VLNDVERRRFLVDPAREDAVPAAVGLLDVELEEGAGQLLLLPRSGRLARAQAHDHVLPADRLAGMQRDTLHDPVALVEDAEHGNPLRHRRHAALAGCGRHHLARGRQRRVVLLVAAIARGKRQQRQQRSSERLHAWSGIHGS